MAFFPEEAAGADLVISWSAVNGGKIVCPKIEIEVDGFGVFFYDGL